MSAATTTRMVDVKDALVLRGRSRATTRPTATRETLLYRCTICGRGQHSKERCALRIEDDRGEAR